MRFEGFAPQSGMRLQFALTGMQEMSTDYISPNLSVPDLAALFPNMIVGDTQALTWPYFRKEIGHTWYTDRRNPQVGFINRDEAAVLYSNARLFAGRRGIEIGAWRGWSTCHLLVSGLASLHVVEPLLADAEWRGEFAAAVAGAGAADRAILIAGTSPEEVVRLGEAGERWSFAFIDGDHDGQAPTNDALACEPYLEPTAMVVFHDLVSPHVAAALRALDARGWKTMVYQTAQIMGVAWRGDIAPVAHTPDPAQKWSVPDHLSGFAFSA
jgi:predicted O-methyltransferase YrrM